MTRTSATISLASPIAAGATAILEIDWSTKLPGGNSGRGHRMTQRWGDTLFQPTQWYPRLAKYDDLRGWDSSEYLGPAEFYNNFGRFDVTLEVPANWLVSATGVLQNPEEVLTATARERLAQVLESDAEIMIVTPEEVAAGTATATGTTKGAGDRLAWHYVADRVNDFAWATSANYVWRATRATIPGAGPIPIHMLYLPERANRFERAGGITRHALEFYSRLWVPYAFPQLTLQDGPSDGMEYPMVINSSQGAADHEAAHQWWPMMVGTNETWYGWMDEGLNEYMNILSGADLRGDAPRLDGRGQSYGGMSGNESEPTMMWASNYGGPMYGFQTYSKAPMMLSMLGGMFGDEAVQAAIRKYAEAWMFKHPSPWDFAFFMNRELGEDLGWFWYAWLYTTDAVDGSIESVRTAADRVVVTVRQDGAMPAPVVLAIELEGEDDALVKTWPVDVWYDGRRSFVAEVELGGRTVQRVTLDPHGRFPDRDPTDNVWTPGG